MDFNSSNEKTCSRNENKRKIHLNNSYGGTSSANFKNAQLFKYPNKTYKEFFSCWETVEDGRTRNQLPK